MGYGGFPILEERNEEVYSMQYIMLYNPAEAPGGDIIWGKYCNTEGILQISQEMKNGNRKKYPPRGVPQQQDRLYNIVDFS